MQYLGHTDAKMLFVVYLKFTFDCASCILTGDPNPPSRPHRGPHLLLCLQTKGRPWPEPHLLLIQLGPSVTFTNLHSLRFTLPSHVPEMCQHH